MTNHSEEEVILVDPQDRVIGSAPKSAAHSLGLRHRAFSIVLIDDAGRVLLQRRAHEKYHSGGLWANSCCGHPRPGESTDGAAVRRAFEELGVEVKLLKVGTFTYRATLSDGMIEHEIDHVFVGTAVGEVAPDPREVADVAWVPRDELARDLQHNAEQYVVWLPQVLLVAANSGVVHA